LDCCWKDGKKQGQSPSHFTFTKIPPSIFHPSFSPFQSQSAAISPIPARAWREGINIHNTCPFYRGSSSISLHPVLIIIIAQKQVGAGATHQFPYFFKVNFLEILKLNM
jgi:hypothetical protein